MKKALPAAIAILLLYIVDQVTKWYTVDFFERPGGGVPVIDDFFYFVYVQNTGAAWGMGSGNNAFFIVISFIALAALVFFAWKGKFPGRLLPTGAVLLTAGILGNLTDRMFRGAVVDFLDFHFTFGDWSYDYPVFNVADMCIVGAAGLFILAGFFTPEEDEKPENRESRPDAPTVDKTGRERTAIEKGE